MSSSSDRTGTVDLDIDGFDRLFTDDIEPIEFVDVTKRYGSLLAVQDVSISIRAGEFHCLIGPNGSGKTTLGRLAVELEQPSSGHVAGPVDDIGYGFQVPRFYPSLTVRENLVTFSRALGVDHDSEWVSTVRDILRLNRVSHRQGRALSGGFQKKLDLAIALLDRPRYLWLDEPLADLDDVSVARIVSLLKTYADAGGGVVVSTHNFDVFDDVSTHVTSFLDGKRQDTVARGRSDSTDLSAEQYWDALDAIDTGKQP